MNEKTYRWMLYTIVFVIIATISIQVYWNYKNYLTSKQQLINDAQVSLDKAVDDYYNNLAQQSTVDFHLNSFSKKDSLNPKALDSIFDMVQITTNGFFGFDSLHPTDNKKTHIIRGAKADTILKSLHSKNHNDSHNIMFEIDSLKEEDFQILTSKVMISITNDSLNLNAIDSLLKVELKRKNISAEYSLIYQNRIKNTTRYVGLKTQKNNIKELWLSTASKSTFLPQHTELGMAFTNETKLVLKRILGGILLSLLLVLAVISCLFYLLKIIKHQKQLAEVKNDLISNITHEFKTPIATIGVAMESFKNFNVLNDKEKTKTYLDISNNQLSKLNLMVEKLLETATLDSDNLNLNKEKVNIKDILLAVIRKHKMQTTKQIELNIDNEDVLATVDVFHFENALNNILDNAIKYGGHTIEIDIANNGNAIVLNFSDDGTLLTKTNKDKIFEKFYRVPKGNTHDTKGFGIGLYYTKKIIEKHGGTIHLDLSNNKTTFKVSIPNE